MECTHGESSAPAAPRTSKFGLFLVIVKRISSAISCHFGDYLILHLPLQMVLPDKHCSHFMTHPPCGFQGCAS